MLIQIRVLSLCSFPSPCLCLYSLTYCNFCVRSLFIELFDNVRRRVGSLFLVAAPDRGAACSGSSPGEERGEQGQKGRLTPGAGSLFSHQQAGMRSALVRRQRSARWHSLDIEETKPHLPCVSILSLQLMLQGLLVS